MIAVFAAIAASVAMADEWSEYIWQSKNDTAGGATSAFNTGSYWTGGDPPQSNFKYYVKPGWMFATPNTDSGDVLEFPGDELVFDGAQLNVYNGGLTSTYFPQLRFLAGSRVYYAKTRSCKISGRMSVETTAQNPLVIQMNAYEYRFAKPYDVTLTGGSTAAIVLFDDYTFNHPGSPSIGDFAFIGDNSGYYGTIAVSNACALYVKGAMPGTVDVWDQGVFRTSYSLYEAGASVKYGGETAPELGTLTVRTGGNVDIGNTNTIRTANLVLEDGAKLTFHYANATNGQLVVSGAVTATGKTRISIPESLPWNLTAAPEVFPVIKLTGSGDMSEENFVLDIAANAVQSPGSVPGPLPHTYLTVVDGVLCVTRKEVVKVVRGSDEQPVLSSFNSATNAAGAYFWSNMREPEPGKDYLDDGSYRMATPPSAGDWPYVFAGDSLTLASQVAIPGGGAQKARGLSIKELNIYGAFFEVWSGQSVDGMRKQELPEATGVYELTGGIVRTFATSSASYSITFSPFDNIIFLLSSELCGNGTITCQSRYQKAGSRRGPNGNHEFSAFNTNFTGKIRVTLNSYTSSGVTIPNETNFVTFVLRDGRNIGGARPAFTPDAFQLEQMSALRPVANAVIDQENLGLRVSGMGRLQITNGVTLTVKTPITYAGVVRKELEGTLALAARPRFGTGATESTAPTAGENVLLVNDGFVKPLSTNALEGVAVEFAGESAGLAFDAQPEGDGMRSYGACNGWSAPFSFASGVERIPVRIDMAAGANPAEALDTPLALVTVADEAVARAIAGRLRVMLPVRNYSVEVSVALNDLGTYTVSATFKHKGLSLIIR